ncbi:MAG TPA: TetR family transcriptional regulator [Solimonas sp.]|nr:TetR family transcriptional regulator [Solimonas sp.]
MKKDSSKGEGRKEDLRPANGRERLMYAAMQLAATTRSLASLGLREVARTAGLNPNTFYRHFSSFDDLGLAVIDQLVGVLRAGLRERRRVPAAKGLTFDDTSNPTVAMERARLVVRESVGLVLDFVTDHREAYIVGIRELHGTSPILRKALCKVMDDIADDMAEDVLGALRLPLLPAEEVREISGLVIRQMSFFSLEYLEHPEQREQIREQAERFILWLFWGALAARLPGLTPLAPTKLAET